MAVDVSANAMNSLLEKLWLDDLWVPPRSWDSLLSHRAAGASAHDPFHSSSLYSTTSVSEPSLVRLALNALQGMESALISIGELSPLLRYSSADRTSNRIPSLWTRCSSTFALGDLITSIGQFGCIVFLLRRFANYFTAPDFDGVKEIDENPKSDYCEDTKCPLLKFSLINQAFAISVGKILNGYFSALNTLSASISLRRFMKSNDGGCLNSVGHSEITLLEVYLHTTGLRTQIESLGNVCSVSHLTASFPVSSLKDLNIKANSEFSAFPRGGALLSCLYAQLKVADLDHCTLLKFLFLQSYEPYCGFIRSWIYDGRFTDPYNEFVVECLDELSIYADCASSSTVRVRDGAAAPCFLEDCLVPLCRTGQQLQVIIKLLELCNNAGTYDTHQEILPCLVGMSSRCSWFAFPLTFNKGIIETMALERATYYQEMLENIDNILRKLDFSSQQTAAHSMRSFHYLGKNINQQLSSVADNSLLPPLADGRDQCLPDYTLESEVSSIIDEYSDDEDLMESTECSSSLSSEEQKVSDQQIGASHSVEQSYLSALDFSLSFLTDNTWQNLHQTEMLCAAEDVPFIINEEYGHAEHPSHMEIYLVSGKPKLSHTPEFQYTNSKNDLWLFDGQYRKEDENTWLPSHDPGLKFLNTSSDVFGSISMSNTSNKDQHTHETCTSSNIFSLHSWKLEYDSTIFSVNPTLNRGSFFNLRTVLGERCRANYNDSFYEFASVKDPLMACMDKLARHPGPQLGVEHSVKTEALASGAYTSNRLETENCTDVTARKNASSFNVSSTLHNKSSKDLLSHADISGGSTWESLLRRSGNIVSSSRSIRDHRIGLVTAVEMPLDFVMKKSLLDEILLQYKYLSKLTIKFLIEGFKLHQHLLALRCYHFMELADWADLFIMSLWNRKWHVNEVDKRIPEIQGILDLSIQRSSCEGDPNKDRLFVYLKGDDISHKAASPTGIHSFDFLGLGYRVDWPVSIILTPDALKIYAEIFNFLIQVKLAAFSLTNAWCSLKQGCCLDRQKGETQLVSIIIETRHKISHFVCTLQQYVQSQLSQVSWCRFLHSLNHKVEDMFDLESVHMAYLIESLHICFLSDQTRSIAIIIQNILQCAMDFRCCLTGSILDTESSDRKISNRFSHFDISQVDSIRRTFTKNLEELYKIYLHSPKHGEFSISRFWDYLNYNDYYAGIMSKHY